MSRILQENFAPYLPIVMPMLLEIANTPLSQFFYLTADEDEARAMAARPGVELVAIQNKFSVVDKKMIEDKEAAGKLLGVLLDTIGPLLEEYLPEIHNVFLEFLALPYADLVATGAMGLALLVRVVTEIGREAESDTQMVVAIYSSFLHSASAAALAEEEVSPSLDVLLNELALCSSGLPSGVLIDQHLSKLSQIREHVAQMLEAYHAHQDRELSPADEAELKETEQYAESLAESLELLQTVLEDNAQ